MASEWERLVREHGPLVYGTAWRILGHAADTEDVVQEVFIEANRLRQTRPVRQWGGYLRRLAACRALDRLRQRKTFSPLMEVTIADRSDSPEEVAIGRELADRLRQALAQLPPREAAVFCLRYLEDLPNQRIAEILNIRPGAVAVALCKARAKLETMLTETTKHV